MSEKPLAVSIPELARQTGLSESLLYTLANQSKLPGCRRLGKRLVVHLGVFEKWLANGMGHSAGELEES